MKLTVKDISCLPQLNGIKLIAGENGLANEISRCGILDYEYDKSVKDKYYHTNFMEGQLVLTSFLYAKENDYLVADAIKRLVSRGCSGLIIKNIFRLPMHESMLRYADSKGFPIFLLEDNRLFFEDIIVLISDRIRLAESFELQEKIIDSILASNDNDESLAARALLLNPSLCPEMLVFYVKWSRPPSIEDFYRFSEVMKELGFLAPSNSLFYYRKGILFLYSRELFPPGNSEGMSLAVVDAVHQASDHLKANTEKELLSIGVSSLHHSLSRLGSAVKESIFASILPLKNDRNCIFHEKLGVYQLLMSSYKEPAMEQFRTKYITLLMDYDLENKSNLLETAIEFVQCGGSIDKTAQRLYQHKNTIRYRLNKAGYLLNLNVLLPDGYEVLSLAVKLHICTEAAASYKEYLIYD